MHAYRKLRARAVTLALRAEGGLEEEGGVTGLILTAAGFAGSLSPHADPRSTGPGYLCMLCPCLCRFCRSPPLSLLPVVVLLCVLLLPVFCCAGAVVVAVVVGGGGSGSAVVASVS